MTTDLETDRLASTQTRGFSDRHVTILYIEIEEISTT